MDDGPGQGPMENNPRGNAALGSLSTADLSSHMWEITTLTSCQEISHVLASSCRPRRLGTVDRRLFGSPFETNILVCRLDIGCR
jgi:hypothetical protein